MQGIAPFGAPGVGERAFVRVSLTEHAVVDVGAGSSVGAVVAGGADGSEGTAGLTDRGDRQ